jgi:TnpA family transposase
MVRFWHLSAEDLSIVEERRREHNRLGFAVQLCLLRYPGWPLRPDERPPQNPIKFVARQIVADPAERETYPGWAETRREHLALLQKVFSYRPCGSSYSGSLRAYLRGSVSDRTPLQ